MGKVRNPVILKLTFCPAGPPFFISPHQQIENELISTHFSVWGTDKSHRGLNPVNKGGGCSSTEMNLSAKSVFPRGRCGLAHFLDAESMISSSTIPAFSSSLVHGAWSGPPSSTIN
jgi:hypothetical protein